jgi:hypothetical protein
MSTATDLMLCMLLASAAVAAQVTTAQNSQVSQTTGNEPPVKYAIYSSAWSESSNAGLRIVAQNLATESVELISLAFQDEQDPSRVEDIALNLTVPAKGWAETQLPYIDLLFGNDCIAKTTQDDWRLVEISNYTLNPSVRGLIIEDTTSFRIYQCVRPVYTTWIDKGVSYKQAEWVLYHYERRPLNN